MSKVVNGLAIGDVVTLIDPRPEEQGLLLTVRDIGNDSVACLTWIGGELRERFYPPERLQRFTRIIKPGDTVRLRSGGQEMSVDRFATQSIEGGIVVRFDANGKRHRVVFDPRVLEIVR